MYAQKTTNELNQIWQTDPRWKNLIRVYTADQVFKLRGSLQVDYTIARLGANKLWKLLQTNKIVKALGAMTGTQAVQQIQAGLKAIYVSGWQVAGDANDALQTYPDLSLYPVMSTPHLLKRINNALTRADQIQHMNSTGNIDWFAPLIADAEAGFGGSLNTYELIKAMIEAGVSAIHLEDQLSSLKKCGHMGGKVLVPMEDFIEKLITARLAADVLGVSTIIIARTDAESATFIRTNSDPVDQPFLTGERSYEGYFRIKEGIPYAIKRGLAAAPYADMIWCETSKPDIGQAREFAQGIHEKFPDKWLAYNCSPSFNWKQTLDDSAIASFQEKLADMGYKFQFVTLAGFHALNASMFQLAHEYNQKGMTAYSHFQQHEFELERTHGYKALKHQSFVGAGYFDEILTTITQGRASTHSLKDSMEEQQFQHK
jgi:isocitrate lyase